MYLDFPETEQGGIMEADMLSQVHDHILDDLKVNTKTDTIFVLTSIVLNLAILGTNAALASNGKGTTLIVMFIFVALILVINLVAEVGLVKGRQTRTKLISGLITMYEDHGVDKYYDRSLLESYKTRYNLFMLVVLFTGIIAITIPFIVI
jgi:hypothetical protein